jgi:D-alanyl-D-alanine carboxypeptidase/D-alanyl-D-alanine-endopeptidase (penicillin-binding protein 4)
MIMRTYFFFLIVTVILLQSCGASKNLNNSLVHNKKQKYFTGLLVYNPTSGDTIINYNSEKYFTPASTVKLFTLYTSLKTLSDSIATISYYDTSDRRYFKALADPSFLNDSLPNKTYSFLKNTSKELIFIPEYFSDFTYGDGWQWDDFEFYYMPEKSLFPIYGNLANLADNQIHPKYFKTSLKDPNRRGFHRDFIQNTFYKDSIGRKRTRQIPFKTSIELSSQLLSDTLQKPVFITDDIDNEYFKPYISTPTYPIYKRLMNESDNFIAEQLFLIISKNKTNTYRVKNSINYALDSLLRDIPSKPRWVDASGLSRYNLFTPKSMVYLLNKMYNELGKEKVFDLLPSNGEGGHLQKWYPFKTKFLYAKTGSVSNNHNICGFLKTKKGTLLIFSYMNNHFMIKSDDVRGKMNQVLQKIYHTY